MGFLAAFLIIVEILAVSLLVGDLAHLPLAVVTVGDGSSIGIRGAGDVAGIIVCIPLHAALRRVDFHDAAPLIQQKLRPVPISVLYPGDVPSGVIGV